jgi:acyl dehydratase
MRTFSSVKELQDAVGEELGSSDWLLIEQARVDGFAAATDDHQWIHVDPERAAAGPFGTTIAHGYLTLSLLRFSSEIFRVVGASAAINYGLNRVRFIQPVRVGSRVRSTATLDSVAEVSGGAQLVVSHRIDVEPDGTLDTTLDTKPDDKPETACVAETISRVVF